MFENRMDFPQQTIYDKPIKQLTMMGERRHSMSVLLKMEGIGKSFGQVRALNNVSLKLNGGEVLLLIVDGRAPGYSIGATMQEIAELMLDYNVYQAINLDGGSSSIMYYNGRIITKPSAGDKKNGRLLPNGFIVRPSY